jgi:hypothetical protein
MEEGHTAAPDRGPRTPGLPTAQLLPDNAPLPMPPGRGVRAAGAGMPPLQPPAPPTAAAAADTALVDAARPEGLLWPAGPPEGMTEPCGGEFGYTRHRPVSNRGKQTNSLALWKD